MGWLILIPIVISLCALALSIFAIRQSRKYQPRSSLSMGWNADHVSGYVSGSIGTDPNGAIPFVTVRLTNHGSAPARDVRLTIDTAQRDGFADWWYEVQLPDGQPKDVNIPLFTTKQLQDGRWITPDSGRDIIAPVVTVSWIKEASEGQRREKSWQIRDFTTVSLGADRHGRNGS